MVDSAADAFEELVASLDTPMFVVTTAVGDRRAGCLVGFASQVSIEPPRFLVGLSKRNKTFRVATQSSFLAVHVFEKQSMEVVELFGGQTGDRVDKFTRCYWHQGPHGVPILDDAAAWFLGRTIDRIPFGDHVGHLLEPVDGTGPREAGRWVSLCDVRDLRPGHEA